MRAQAIVNKDGTFCLVIALPVTPEIFEEAYISESKKSLVYRYWDWDKINLSGYHFTRLNEQFLISYDFQNHNAVYKNNDIIKHEFNGIVLPCLSIPLKTMIYE